MNRILITLALGVLVTTAVGCSCTTDEGAPDGGNVGLDGSDRPDAVYPDGARADTSDFDATSAEDANVDAGPIECAPAQCDGHTYLCGNCIDDDGDGLVDSADDGCLGPCDSSEDVYDLLIPGGDTATCMIDCYFDNDQGSGNDGCGYDSRCDPLGSGTDPGHDGRCGAEPGATCPETQPEMCADICAPLVPNGCDCFGCCEITPGSGDYVFLGSIPEPGHEMCNPDTLDDPESCRPCTPVAACLNTCGRCELCFGRDTLPPDCIGVDGGTPIDAAGVDAGTPDVRCDPDEQPCGLPGDPACPSGEFCLSGCCGFFG